MYASINFKTKKALKDVVAAGTQIRVWQPGPFGDSTPREGKVALEGPHYPQPHRWYAEATLSNGIITSVK